MAHALWSGSVNFGLVSIPVRLVAAIRPNELRFHFLHDEDHGRISNVRLCDSCGKRVEWDHVVRGFEAAKERYVVVSDEDFARVDVEATQSIDIVQFVQVDEIDPVLFDKPYYLEPEKNGRHAYGLLRDVLIKTRKVGIAQVVIRTRQHVAAVKPRGATLVLELMHYADEIVDEAEIDAPSDRIKASAPEMKSAAMLVEAMSASFDPAAFKDTYREELTALIEARARGERPALGKAKARKKATNVIDLREVLRRSLDQTRKRRKKSPHRKHVA